MGVARGQHPSPLSLQGPRHDRRTAAVLAAADEFVHEFHEVIRKTYSDLPAHTEMYQCGVSPALRVPPVALVADLREETDLLPLSYPILGACRFARRATMGGVVAREQDLQIDGVTLRVRESGDPDGQPVLYFHGTPGCRLEMAWADQLLANAGVRWVAFDRPGYGGSAPTSFTVRSVAKMALLVADQCGLERFRTAGWSGGGPFALGTAAVAGERVEGVGVIAGAAPFQAVPGALDVLSDGDRAAERLLPGNPEAACTGFLEGFDMTQALKSSTALYEDFEPLLSDSDRRLWGSYSEHLLASMREAMRQGGKGLGWDNVAWIGAWDIDPTTVECPVLLWYGTEDRMAKPIHGHWFAENLPDGRLTMRGGEGHLQPFAHLAEMLADLMAA